MSNIFANLPMDGSYGLQPEAFRADVVAPQTLVFNAEFCARLAALAPLTSVTPAVVRAGAPAAALATRTVNGASTGIAPLSAEFMAAFRQAMRQDLTGDAAAGFS